MIRREHFQQFMDLGLDCQAKGIDLHHHHYRLEHVGTVTLVKSGTHHRGQLSAFVRDILPFIKITGDCISIKKESSDLFHDCARVSNDVLAKLDSIISKNDSLMRNVESKSTCKEANKNDGGQYQTLALGSIRDISSYVNEIYHRLRLKYPNLPSIPVFLDSGGGQGRIALLTAAQHAWMTISVEIFPLKAFLEATTLQEVYNHRYFRNLKTAVFMGDASKADNWNGVQIVITWDCVFTCPVYNGMIDNLARTSDNHLIILITSARLLKDAVERDLHGTTREEYLKQ